MRIKCSCKKIINCEPNGNCWCKQLNYKIKKSNINTQNEKCLCKDCLKERLQNSSHSYI